MVNTQATPLTPTQQEMLACWQRHMQAEFMTGNVEEALATMTAQPIVNHVPVLTGGVGREAVRDFYAHHFIGRMRPDTEMVPVAHTIGDDRLVEEFVARFTHTQVIDWLVPGIAPTGKRVEVAVIAVIQFEGGAAKGLASQIQGACCAEHNELATVAKELVLGNARATSCCR
jgi:carboxymethylenebutenolidase